MAKKTESNTISKTDPKSKAWDLVGGLFWEKGRKSAKPSPNEINQFLEVNHNAKICIIGASTRDLVEAALIKNLDVTVMDFSTEMCNALTKEFPNTTLKLDVVNILGTIPKEYFNRFDLIVSDRLLNRFTTIDAPSYFENIFTMLCEGGVSRTCVKMGFYEMDERLIAEGKDNGSLEDFFNDDTRTIDYSKAESSLEAIEITHGDISRDILLEWYKGRGKESRFDKPQVLHMINDTLPEGQFEILPTVDFSENETSLLFCFRKT